MAQISDQNTGKAQSPGPLQQGAERRLVPVPPDPGQNGAPLRAFSRERFQPGDLFQRDIDPGRAAQLQQGGAEAVRSRELDGLPETLAAAVVEAREVLDTTRDPQLSDIVLDRWCYRDMAALAEETGSAFLRGYVAVQVDAVNLRTAVRTLRMGKGADFLLGALLEGGDLAPDAVAKAASSGAAGLRELYGATRFRDAAEAGAEALKGGPLTAFEKLCDDAVGDYLAGAQSVPFGEAPLVSYLAARETEYTNLRILLMGRAAGIDPAVIRTRLRASYV